MSLYLTQLLEILQKEVVLHQELLGTLREEAQSLGQVSGAALLKLHSAKIMFSRKIAGLEQERLIIVQNIAEEWQMEARQLSLRTIISMIPSEMALPLQHCFDQLKQLIEAIQSCADHNSRISEARLGSVESSLKFLQSMKKRQHTYSGAGIIQPAMQSTSRISV
ncbi:MAG: flagellar protein FlgN [SAR324 cluster bacterium]|nr:flagellar protein FlgN [SAR324 cluster bacterium]